MRTLILLVLATSLVGCSRNQQPLPNPFASGDRVPPPLTRAGSQSLPQPTYYSPSQTAPLPANTPYTAPGAPLGQTQTLNPAQVASRTGDSVSVPTDSTSLRFGSVTPTPRTIAGGGGASVPSIASRPATANGWVSGSAPVRTRGVMNSSTAIASTRVRLPGADASVHSPVDVAALSPGGAVAPTPQSVASNPSGTTGWR